MACILVRCTGTEDTLVDVVCVHIQLHNDQHAWLVSGVGLLSLSFDPYCLEYTVWVCLLLVWQPSVAPTGHLPFVVQSFPWQPTYSHYAYNDNALHA